MTTQEIKLTDIKAGDVVTYRTIANRERRVLVQNVSEDINGEGEPGFDGHEQVMHEGRYVTTSRGAWGYLAGIIRIETT